jgi:hypothetical protein
LDDKKRVPTFAPALDEKQELKRAIDIEINVESPSRFNKKLEENFRIQ